MRLHSITFDREEPAGAGRVLGQEYGITWSTFADPEGNEFCFGLHPEA